jgi:uncharacterized protein YyaL (SSP411 family)
VANALAQETSPYLRQHAGNPVDWLPWGPVALSRARELDRPILVSIGYSACHWCHVMERESFEDPRTAELMNENFVCVKVDREERPDLDALYMEAVHGMTGRGGWPLNVFLTPEQLPFYGGTYYPPDSRGGMPAWTQVLQAIAEAWSERREEIRAGGERLGERLSGGAQLEPTTGPFDASILDDAVARLAEHFDQRHGGFGGAPKFPPASAIEFLLARASVRSDPLATPAADMALRTLEAMAGGGIRDVLGGGFHRYAVDGSWTVPHFEKMLYDNALLARAYLHGYQASGESRLLEICTATLDWALREMLAPEGGFYASLDADSAGTEGRFYVWTIAELRATLREDTDAAIAWLGVSDQGNFDDPHHPQPGLNVLTDRGPRPEQAARERIRTRLLEVRETRERPGLDDKRLTSWNALMIAALADAGAALPDSPYLQAASACAEFVEGDLRDPSGRLLRTYNDGRAKIDAYLEDHGLLLEGLIALFEASCEERWFLSATSLADEIIDRFADPERGGFFSTASDGEALIARRKELEDTPIPSGSSSAALGLLRLSQLTGSEEYERHALSAMALVAELAPRLPSSFGHMLQAMHWRLEPARPIACPVPQVPQRAARRPEPGRA